jgi:pyocin large subunit-like protein
MWKEESVEFHPRPVRANVASARAGFNAGSGGTRTIHAHPDDSRAVG